MGLNLMSLQKMATFALPLLIFWFVAPTDAAAQNFRNRGHETVFSSKSSALLPVFTPIITPIPGVEYSAVAWGDYDNDGRLDILATGLTAANQLISKIYRNEGGSFAEIPTTLGGTAQSAVAWGDYDNDGDLDLLLCGEGSVSKIYRNDRGNFVDIHAPLVGVGRGAVDWGDYDNDGDLDVLLMGWNEKGIAKIYRNDKGQFADINATLKGGGGGSANWGDYDNDGDLDILLTGFHDNGIYVSAVYANDRGIFSDIAASLPGVTLGTGAWGDYDNDGDLDILLAGLTPALRRVATVFHNDAGQFVDIAAALDTLEDVAAAWGDYDNDGDLDILLAGYINSIRVSKIFQNNNGVFVDIAAGLKGIDRGCVAWGDYDNDGDLDILLTGAISPEYNKFISKVFRNDNGFFVDSGTSLIGVHGGSVAWGDYDNDGDLDILLAGWTEDAFHSDAPRATKIYRNDGNRFVDIAALLVGIGGGTVDWGDFDNDGDLDLLLTGIARDMGTVTKIYRNDVGDNFIDINAALDPVFRSTAVWGDYDNDGDLDILLAGYSPARPSPIAKIYRNDGGNFVAISANLMGVGNATAAWGDYDNGGDLDILLSGFTPASINETRIYRNDKGNFTDIGISLPGGEEGTVAWGDYDNDGALDVLLGRINQVYKNDNGSFANISASLPGSPIGTTNFGRGGSISWGDHDNDGDLDLLLTDFCNIIVFRPPYLVGVPTACSKVYRNDAPKPNRAPASPFGLAHTVSDYSVSFSWGQAGDDETASAGLTYNLRIGLTPGGGEIVSPMSGASTGYRRVPKSGNMGHANQWKIASLPEGKYYWSVQAVDPAFGGSAFAPEDSFAIQSESATIDPLAFDFGKVNIGGTRDTVLALISRRTASLTVFDIEIAGADSLNFSFIGDTGFVLNGGEQRALPVRFQPRSLGNKSARLIIYHGGSEGYSFANLAGNGVDLEPPVIAAVSAASVIPFKTSLAVSAQIYDNNAVQQVRLLYRQGGQVSFEFVGMSLDPSSSYVNTLPDTSAGIRGVEFDIEATDGINNPTRAGWRSVRVSLPDKFLSRTHAGGLSQDAYRLISIPLDSNDPLVASTLLDDLGPADTTLWRLWDIDPQRAHSLFPYREYPTVDNMAPGKAKFLITSEDKNLTSGRGETVRTVLPFEMRLQPGWNMIANPFNFAIPIANVYPEILRAQLYTYNGAWVASPDLLKPWEGYLIKAVQPVTLSILPSEGVVGLPSPISQSTVVFDWSIRLEAACERARDFDNAVGIVKDATIEWDRYERFEPPPIGEYVMLAFPHREWQRLVCRKKAGCL